MFVMYVENGFVKMVSLLCKSIESKQARPKLHLRFDVRNSNGSTLLKDPTFVMYTENNFVKV